jgi:MFS family permease
MVINVVTEKERGLLNGYMQAGMLVGRSVFGGGALFMLTEFGLPIVFVLLIASIFITMMLLVFVKEPLYRKTAESRFKNFIGILRESFNKKNTWLAILFALTSAAAFETAGALAGPFLTDKNVSEKTVGFFYAIPVVASMLIGGLLGGRLSDRFSRKRSVGKFLVAFVIPVIVIAAMDWSSAEIKPVYYIVGFSIMYLFVGMFVASSYALFKDLTNPKLGATQFSTYMSATNGCEVWTVWAAGRITGLWDYSYAFLLMGVISLLSLVVLRNIKRNN